MIIKSLLDLDFYKLSMGNVVFHRFPTAQVEYRFVCRSKDVDLLPYMQDIKDEINTLDQLHLTLDEYDYLKTIRFLDPAFIEFLRQLELQPKKEVQVYNDGNNMTCVIKGSWLQTIWYETMILAIVNEIYFRDKMPKHKAIEAAITRLQPKLVLINDYPDLRFSEFGTRRRHSFDVQAAVLSALKKDVGDQLNGTSNVHLARVFNLKPIGTQAHEYFMAHQGLFRIQESQQRALKTWAEDFDGDLGIALTDTLNMDAFLRDFSKFYAKLFDGCRHDSGDPIVWGDKLIAHYKRLGIDPKTKMAVFSDGLDIPKAVNILDHFRGRIGVSFGIGTDLTNDVGLKAINIVIKMVRCNGQAVAKVSDAPGKNICDDATYVAYLRNAFGI